MFESKKGASDQPRDRKGGLSCSECRRSKLKCDRVFPCQSCIRRGCAAICPDGTLAATKGNKVLMAHAQKLTDQVKTKSARIKELEHALSEKCQSGEHPLLKGVGSEVEIEGPDLETLYDPELLSVSDAIGSLQICEDGGVKYHGESIGSEYFADLLPYQREYMPRNEEACYLGMPLEIIELINAFPFGLRDCPYTKLHFVSFLPTRERALELTDLYYQNVAWMYDPIVRQDFMNNVITPIYGSTGYATVNTVHPHRLSIFFILLASAISSEETSANLMMAERYSSLARAAFSLDPFVLHSTCATVQVLLMMIRFEFNWDPLTYETRWILTGLSSRISQVIGLQRDSAGFNLDKEEIQRRRLLFWELYTYDAWTSLVNGRPPSLMIQHTDCRFPDDLDASMTPCGEVELGFHAWKFRFSASCLSISVQHVFSTKMPHYAALLELDRKIRKFPIPSHLQSPVQGSASNRSWSSDPPHAMQQFCVLCERECNLLHIHRSFFAQAIKEEPQNPLAHKYAPSVLAIYRSACRIISSLKGLYPVHPKETSRSWFFWSATFSSCIVLGALVVQSPGCSLAQPALQELEQAVPFYEGGCAPCRPASTLTTLNNLHRRAYSSYATFHGGTQNREPPDELGNMSGRNNAVSNTTLSPHSPSSNHSSTSSLTRELPAQFENGRPSLMEYYNELGTPGIANYEMGQPYGETSAYLTSADSPPMQQSQAYIQPSTIEYPHYQQQPPYALDQQSLNALGFVTQEEIWQGFIRQLGIQGS